MLTNTASKRDVLPKEIATQLEAFKQAQKQAEAVIQERAQETAFDGEFASVLKEFPDLADRKEELKELAFSEGNINTSLRLLALGYRHDNALDKPGRKSAETPTQAKRDTTEVIDFATMTDDQLKGLNEEQFAQFETWMVKNSRR